MQTTGLKVLIIEDRRENIVFLANNILKPKGFEVITAMDGEAGLRKALEENPNLIITDLNLPKLHGLDILADLQDRGSNIPSIVMTFHGSEETAIRAFRLGARDYLIKPFQVEEVEKAIERALDLPKQSPPASADTAYTRELEQKISDLEKNIAHQQERFKAQEQPASALTEKLAEQEKKLQYYTDELARLNNLLSQQKQLTLEARNSAKALIQFMIAQHKELLRQRGEVDRLVKQMAVVSTNLSKLATRLDNQTEQFHLILPKTEQKQG